MEKVNNQEEPVKKISTEDLQKFKLETEIKSLMLDNELRAQQIVSQNLEIWSTKIKVLNSLKELVKDDKETLEDIDKKISKLLGNIVNSNI
jgi:hypothetical protein